ncbi:MAG: cyclic nucleotide-binding domain-containing protein [Elusimicrobiota bacterium]
MENLEFLKEIELLREMGDEELIKILRFAKEEFCKEGKKIFDEGDTGDRFYIVKSGLIKITKRSEKTQQDEFLAYIREKQFFGEMALLTDMPRCATATAKKDSVLIMISKQDFEKILNETTEIALKVYKVFINVLCKRLRKADNKMADSFFTPPPLSSVI